MAIALDNCPAPGRSCSRRLGRLESYFSANEITMRAAVLVSGRVDARGMSDAFRALLTTNPVLRSVVLREEHGFALHTPDSISNQATIDVRPGNPRAFVDKFAETIDQTTHLVELAVIEDKHESAVAMTICHCISDLTALTGYMHELWENYTDLMENGTLPERGIRPIPNGPEHWVTPAELPKSPVRQQDLTMAQLPSRSPANTTAANAPSGKADFRDRIHLEFSRATTDALRRATKARGTTVHAAVAGAILTAERSLIARKGPVPMALRSSVDLRRRLPDQSVEPLAATAFIGMITTYLHVDHEDSALSVGKLVVDDIRDRIADGTAIASSVQSAESQRPATSYAANGGTIPEIPTPAGTEIKKVVFGSGKEIKRSAPLYYGSWTYSGQLNIDIGVPRSTVPKSAQRRLESKIRSAILHIAGSDLTTRESRPPVPRGRFLRKTLAGICLSLVCLLGLAPSAFACSRVTWSGSDGRVVTGRSMDWPDWFNEHLYVIPRGLTQDGAGGVDSVTWTGKYGAAVIAGSVVPDEPVDAAFDGMNENGLVANLLFLGETDFGPAPTDHRPRLSVAGWVPYVLTNFGTVNEVVAAFQDPELYIAPAMFGPNRSQYPTVHLAVSDASGDSAIFEYLDGKVVVHHGRQYQVMTNSPTYDEQLAIAKSWESQDRNHSLPGSVQAKDRFVRASYYLSRLPATADERQAVAGVFSVMRNVQVPWGAGGSERYATHWVTVADATAKTYYFESMLSPNVVQLDLKGIDFAPGSGVRAVRLQEDYSLIGNIDNKLVPAAPIALLAP
jgi:choloylglycine hydrolase